MIAGPARLTSRPRWRLRGQIIQAILGGRPIVFDDIGRRHGIDLADNFNAELAVLEPVASAGTQVATPDD